MNYNNVTERHCSCFCLLFISAPLISSSVAVFMTTPTETSSVPNHFILNYPWRRFLQPLYIMVRHYFPYLRAINRQGQVPSDRSVSTLRSASLRYRSNIPNILIVSQQNMFWSTIITQNHFQRSVLKIKKSFIRICAPKMCLFFIYIYFNIMKEPVFFYKCRILCKDKKEKRISISLIIRYHSNEKSIYLQKSLLYLSVSRLIFQPVQNNSFV